MDIINKTTRSLLALSIALVLLFSFAFPVAASAQISSSIHNVNVAVLYDESFASFVESEIGVDPVQRIEQILNFAKIPLINALRINLNYTIMSYESLFGESYAASIDWPDYCDNLWQWAWLEQEDHTYAWEKEWNHLNGLCVCREEPNCFINLQTPGHHTSARRVLYDMHSVDFNHNLYDLAITFVGHRLCRYDSSAQNHSNNIGGLSINDWNVSVISSVFDFNSYLQRTNDHYATDSSVYHVSNFLSNVHFFLHEISHDFDAFDGQCTANSPCIMSGGFSGIVFANGMWCSNCKDNCIDASKFD